MIEYGFFLEGDRSIRYRELQTVNRGFKRRLNSAFAKDANLNAIGSLLYVSMGVTYGLEDNLRELRERFCPKG